MTSQRTSQCVGLALAFSVLTGCKDHVSELHDCRWEDGAFVADGEATFIHRDKRNDSEESIVCAFFLEDYTLLCESATTVDVSFAADDDEKRDFSCHCPAPEPTETWYCQSYVDL